MGEEKEPPRVFAVNQDTGESFEIGRLVEPLEITEDGLEGKIIPEDELFKTEGIEAECTITIPRIKKKRFIKLLMAKGYQRNEAIKMHEEFRKHGYLRSRFYLEIFVSMYEFTKKEMKGQSKGEVVGIYGKGNKES